MKKLSRSTLGSFVAVDVETTGLYPLRGDRIIEIGAIKVMNSVLADVFHSLIGCERRISKCARLVHGISNEMLIQKPDPYTAFGAFRSFVGYSVLVAHNAIFDKSFLRKEYRRLGWVFPNKLICSLELAKKTISGLPDYRLATVARHLLGEQLSERSTHRALDDARLTARVMLELSRR